LKKVSNPIQETVLVLVKVVGDPKEVAKISGEVVKFGGGGLRLLLLLLLLLLDCPDMNCNPRRMAWLPSGGSVLVLWQ
jgi:hypothetical protein